MSNASKYTFLKLLGKELESLYTEELDSSSLLEQLDNKVFRDNQDIVVSDEGGGYYIAQIGDIFWSYKKSKSISISEDFKKRVSAISSAYIKNEVFSDHDAFESLSKSDKDLFNCMMEENIFSYAPLSATDMKTLFYQQMKNNSIFENKILKELGITKLTKSAILKHDIAFLLDAEKSANLIFLGKYFDNGYRENRIRQIRLKRNLTLESINNIACGKDSGLIIKVEKFIAKLKQTNIDELLPFNDRVAMLQEKSSFEKQISASCEALELTTKEINYSENLTESFLLKFTTEADCSNSLMKPKLDFKKLEKKIHTLKGVKKDDYRSKDIFKNLGFSSKHEEAKISIDTIRNVSKGTSNKLEEYRKNLFVL